VFCKIASVPRRISSINDEGFKYRCSLRYIGDRCLHDLGSLCQRPEFSCLNGGSCHEQAMELLASVRTISRDLCAKTQWIPWPDASIHRRVLTVERVTNRTERFSASVRQDLAVPGGQTMSTIVLIHPFVSTGAFASTESTISPAPATGNLFSLFSLFLSDC
jgi:hypothetical protein